MPQQRNNHIKKPLITPACDLPNCAVFHGGSESRGPARNKPPSLNRNCKKKNYTTERAEHKDDQNVFTCRPCTVRLQGAMCLPSAHRVQGTPTYKVRGFGRSENRSEPAGNQNPHSTRPIFPPPLVRNRQKSPSFEKKSENHQTL